MHLQILNHFTFKLITIFCFFLVLNWKQKNWNITFSNFKYVLIVAPEKETNSLDFSIHQKISITAPSFISKFKMFINFFLRSFYFIAFNFFLFFSAFFLVLLFFYRLLRWVTRYLKETDENNKQRWSGKTDRTKKFGQKLLNLDKHFVYTRIRRHFFFFYPLLFIGFSNHFFFLEYFLFGYI